jgi:phosphoribosylanthranilate isomerase
MGLEIKICGMTSFDDVNAALDEGADYVGFVLHPASPRAVDAARVRQILDRVGARCRAVAVAVNQPRLALEALAADCGLWAVQLHGDELPDDFAGVSFRLWRAIRAGREGLSAAPEAWKADRYVVDAAVPGMYGGTRVLADWKAAAELARKYSVLLAGGLTPENVADGVAAVRPRGVDVVSGVESAPGKKDYRRVRDFIAAARRAGEGL